MWNQRRLTLCLSISLMLSASQPFVVKVPQYRYDHKYTLLCLIFFLADFNSSFHNYGITCEKTLRDKTVQ